MTTLAAREPFLPDHKWLEDGVLLAPPARGPFTPLTLFVCTYVAKLDNLHVSFVELTRRMCEDPHGRLLAINSNFGHAAQPGFEHLLKAPKPPPERRVPARGRPRKVQGDGTCFNSAVEPVVAVDHPAVSDDKVYFVKCFPTTGETQVPGVILPDLSDGHAVLEAFVAYLNELGVGDEAPPAGEAPPVAPRKAVTIAREQPKMINYKFRLVRNSPRILVNLHALAAYLCILERTKATEGTELTAAQAARFAGWPVVVLPPFPVRETKSPTDDVKVSFRFKEAARAPRLNVFQENKVNILGADSVHSAERIYDFFVRLFTANWAMLVSLQPRRDLERRQALRPPPRVVAAAAAAAAAAPPRPPVKLSDAEVDLLLADVLGTADEVRAAHARLDELEARRAEAQATLRGAEGELEEKLGNLRVLGSLADPAVAGAVDAAVSDIVADLGEWGFEDGDEDESDYDDGELSGGENGEPPGGDDGEPPGDDGAPARPPATLQDMVFGEVDREDVEDHQEDAL